MKEKCKIRFAPVVEAIRHLTDSVKECAQQKQEKDSETGRPILIGIDGMCATGKTTLGYYLQEQFDCQLFHMDDFFLRPEQRTPERMSQIGGNVDYERFRLEVLDPLCRKEEVFYRPYCCKTGVIEPGRYMPFKQLNIIEGSYSLHPFFGDIYDLRIFTESTSDRQRQNILLRNGENMLQRFIGEWIPMENAYFDEFRIREKCIRIPWAED